jgi:hypothetical protein
MSPQTSNEVRASQAPGGASQLSDKAGLRTVDVSETAPVDEQQPWRPWPWNYFPDNLCISFSWLLLSFVGPPMAILIGTGEVTWKLLQGIYFRVEALQRIRQRVLDVAEVVGKKIMRDPRDFSYLPWMLWLSLYCPFILYYFYQRHAQHGFEWTMFLLYHFLRIGPRFRFFAHTHVLQHKVIVLCVCVCVCARIVYIYVVCCVVCMCMCCVVYMCVYVCYMSVHCMHMCACLFSSCGVVVHTRNWSIRIDVL